MVYFLFFLQFVSLGVCDSIFAFIRYAKMILRSLASAPHPRLLGSEQITSAQLAIFDTMSEYTLYKGRPGAECGHISESSSYFDRLWCRENMTERYIFVLKKVQGTSALRIKPKGNTSRMKIHGNLNAGPAPLIVTSSRKKILFGDDDS